MRTRRKSSLDLDAVREALLEMLAAGKTTEAIELVIELLSQLRDKNTQLELERMRLLRRHVGQTSERISGEQLRLLFDSVAAAGEEAAKETPRAGRRAARPTGSQAPRGEACTQGAREKAAS